MARHWTGHTILAGAALLVVACERTDTTTGAAPRVEAAVGGPTCNVPMDYPTIQDAVDASGCTTIDVAPGMYNENVLIGRTLTLNGAQAGNPVATRAFGGPLESTVKGSMLLGDVPVFQIAATGVTIDGFSVTNSVASGSAIGIGVKVTGSGAVVKNNIIDGVVTPDPVIVTSSSAQAIYLQNGPDDVLISGNELSHVFSIRSAKGIFIGDAGSTDPSTNVLIQGNSISDVTSDNRGAYGILVNNGNGSTANAGLEIRDNTITTLTGSSLLGGGWVHAIGLEANTPNVVVRGNSIAALFSPSPNKVAVFFEVNPSYATGMVNQNNFDVTILAYGIAVAPAIVGAGDVDGTCNWWGDPTGPGGPGGSGVVGAMVSPRVDYTPWLSAPAPNGACIGGLPSTPGKVTGGGQIDGDPVFAVDGVLLSLPALVPSLGDPNSRATFGFVVQAADGAAAPTGNLEYNDHDAGVRIKATSFDRLVISDGTCGPQTQAEFTGMASVENQTGTHTEPLTVKVDDCGNPGTMGDKFGITTVPSYQNGPSVLIGGNIKIH